MSLSVEHRTMRISQALHVAVDRREKLVTLRACGRAGAGAEALCNGALRNAIRLSYEYIESATDRRARPLSRRQMDRLMQIVTERRSARLMG